MRSAARPRRTWYEGVAGAASGSGVPGTLRRQPRCASPRSDQGGGRCDRPLVPYWWHPTENACTEAPSCVPNPGAENGASDRGRRPCRRRGRSRWGYSACRTEARQGSHTRDLSTANSQRRVVQQPCGGARRGPRDSGRGRRLPRRPSAVPETAASASTGGRRHRTSGTGIGATAIASTSTSVRV
jgi:hypothetical protein